MKLFTVNKNINGWWNLLTINISLTCDNFFFSNSFLSVPRPTLGHSQGDSLTNPMLITAFVHILPEGHQEPRSKVGSLSPAKHLADFEPGTFRLLMQRLNPPGHSPQIEILDYICRYLAIKHWCVCCLWGHLVNKDHQTFQLSGNHYTEHNRTVNLVSYQIPIVIFNR